MNWPWKLWNEEKNLEAQVFLKHRTMFETSLVDCLYRVLKNLRAHDLISEKLARKIESMKHAYEYKSTQSG